jgi:hypothetical protein
MIKRLTDSKLLLVAALAYNSCSAWGNYVKLKITKTMKKLMFALVALLGSVAFVSANVITYGINQTPAGQQDEKVKIKPEELPEAVKKALEMQDYRGWLVDAAYKDSKTENYEVHLKNGAETKIVKFNKDGKKVE